MGVGGGGFVAPNNQHNKIPNTGTGLNGPVGGGGFIAPPKPNNNFGGSSNYGKTNYGSNNHQV